MMDRNFLFLTAFFAEPEDGTLAELKIAFDLQRDDRSDSSKCVSQDTQNRLVPQTDDVAEVNGINQLLNVFGRWRWRFAFVPRELGRFDFPGRVHCQNTFLG